MPAASPQGAQGPHTQAAFAQLQQRTADLQHRVAAATRRLEQQRQQVGEAAAATRDALRCCDAMPAFKPSCAPGGLLALVSAGGEGEAAAQRAALLARQPLEPALAALRDDIRTQLQQLRLGADDLQDCLMVRRGGGEGRDGGRWRRAGKGCVWLQ